MIAFLLALLRRAALHRRVAELLPTAVENRFLEIPWRLDLMATRAEAVRVQKPIFVWLMNGHPLGCT